MVSSNLLRAMGLGLRCLPFKASAMVMNQIHGMLYIEFGVVALLFISTLTYIYIFHPDQPPTPPSTSAAIKRLDFKAGMKALTYKFWIIAFTFAVLWNLGRLDRCDDSHITTT